MAVNRFDRDDVIRRAKLSMPLTFLLLTISNRLGRNRSAWPSYEALAYDMNANERSVRNWVSELVEMKILKVTGGGGRGRSNSYEIVLDALPMKPERTPRNQERHSGFGDDGEDLNQERHSEFQGDKPGTSFTKPGTSFQKTRNDIPGNYKGNCSENSKGKQKRSQKAKFQPPTVEQVRQYAAEIGFPELDPEHLVQHYAATNWTKKDGSPVTSWKQCVLTWKSIRQPSQKRSTEAEKAWAKCLEAAKRYVDSNDVRIAVGDRAYRALKEVGGPRHVIESHGRDLGEYKKKFIEAYSQTDEVAA